MFYTISETAKLLNIPPSTLRYYDKEGLLPFVERTKTGIRMFKDRDFESIRIIICLKKAGMQLKSIKKFINMAIKGDETIEQRLELLLEQKKSTENQIAQLQKTLQTINFKCWYYKTAKETSSSYTYNMSDEEIPEEFRSIRKELRKLN